MGTISLWHHLSFAPPCLRWEQLSECCEHCLGWKKKSPIRPAERCEPQKPLRDAAFPFPPLQQTTSHIHVRHGMSLHHVLHTASLEILKIKNVANHKYLKSPGAGICTVFKQRFLIWYLFFLQQQHASCEGFFSSSSISLLWQWKISHCSGTAEAEHYKFHLPSCTDKEWSFSLSWPLCHLFQLFSLSGFCLSVWWSDGMRDGSVARSPSAAAQEQV